VQLETEPVYSQLVSLHTSEMLGFYGESRAVRLDLTSAGPHSILIHNPSERTVRPLFLSLDSPDTTRLFGWTSAAALSALIPEGPLKQKPQMLVGPELRQISTYAIGPSLKEPVVFSTAPLAVSTSLALTVRTVVGDPSGGGTHLLRIFAFDRSGTLLWTQEVPVSAPLSPFESLLDPAAFGVSKGLKLEGPRAVDTAATNPAPASAAVASPSTPPWIGEPVRLLVTVTPGMGRLVLSAPEGPLLVTAALPGPPTGDPRRYPLPYGGVRVRYRSSPPSVWQEYPPSNQVSLDLNGQRARMEAMVRLEPRGGGVPPSRTTRAYVSLAPSTSTALNRESIWLLPSTGRAEPGLRYCVLRPSRSAQTFVFPAHPSLAGQLLAFLWTPELRWLGGDFSVTLDGRPWRSGLIRQPLTPLHAVRQPETRQVGFEGPPGARLLLRTYGTDRVCADPRRPQRYYPLPPGGRVDFVVQKSMPEQLVMVGGLGNSGALKVLIDGGAPIIQGGAFPYRTPGDRSLEFAPGDSDPAIELRGPDRSLPVLESQAFRLGVDLQPGSHRLTFINPARQLLWIRVGLESLEAGQPEAISVVGWNDQEESP
jgi:hypothetical protein